MKQNFENPLIHDINKGKIYIISCLEKHIETKRIYENNISSAPSPQKRSNRSADLRKHYPHAYIPKGSDEKK